MLLKEQIDIGRKLCFILRHNIIDAGLNMDLEGYVNVKEIFDKKLINFIGIIELKYIVDNDDKNRFSLIEEDDEYFIRANQGHSLAVGKLILDDSALEVINEPYDFCAHGTEQIFYESICKNGLNRCSRKHIHLVSEIIKEKQISGYKKKSNCIIVINMKQCMDDGMIFYKSANNVILTEGFNGIIDPKYFKEIIKADQ